MAKNITKYTPMWRWNVKRLKAEWKDGVSEDTEDY